MALSDTVTVRMPVMPRVKPRGSKVPGPSVSHAPRAVAQQAKATTMPMSSSLMGKIAMSRMVMARSTVSRKPKMDWLTTPARLPVMKPLTKVSKTNTTPKVKAAKA